jgi:hypothetical protein
MLDSGTTVTREATTTMGAGMPYWTSPKLTESSECQHRPLPYDPVRDAIAGINVESTDTVLYGQHETDGTLQKPYQLHGAQVISEKSPVSWQPSHLTILGNTNWRVITAD